MNAKELDEFRTQADSLKIPASRIAAITGYHPYALLPEILIDFVYQGPIGNVLRRQDCCDLKIELVPNELLLLNIAQKAGSGTVKAFEVAMQVKEGTKVLENVKAAAIIKKKVLEEAKKSNKLSANELKRLDEGSRNYVDTGFGTCHEDDALNIFEKQCGWKVQERNAAVMKWPFARAEEIGGSTDTLTVSPLQKAFSQIHRNSNHSDPHPSRVVNEKVIVEDSKVKPFFSIYGAVDGVRDELWCRSGSNINQSVDEGEWDLRKVIVECKHRMRKGSNTPPLYDQIQTAAYCLMYGTEVADIVEVVRTELGSDHPRKRVKREQTRTECVRQTEKQDKSSPRPVVKILEMHDNNSLSGRKTIEHLKTPGLKHPVTGRQGKSKDKMGQSIKITVSRLELDDAIMSHRLNWQSIILPRIRSFVEAVYRVRADESLRKLFLQVVLEESESGFVTQLSWDLLHHECPWLKDCDTAWRRM